MSGPKALTDRSVAERWQEVKSAEQWWDDLGGTMRNTMKTLLEDSLDCELLEQIQATAYQRNPDRVDYRNGYRFRSLQTRLGVIVNLRVPRSRDGRYQSHILQRFGRRETVVTDLICDAFLGGLSTRRVGEVLEPLLGEPVSPSTVSQITKTLDAEVRRYHNRPLPTDIVYVFLDGIVLKVKGGAKVQRKVILAAYGLTSQGERVLLDFQVATSESSLQWEGFLNDLYRRGIDDKKLRLIITDGGTGLHDALQVVYGSVKRQRCWVHKLRNVMSKLPVRYRIDCLSQLRMVYTAESTDNARNRYRIWSEKWKPLVPTAVECVEKDIDELLNFLNEPPLLAIKLRTTNAIERVFREVRRRTRPMSCFNSDGSCERIIFAVFNHQNRTWKDRFLPEFTHNS